MNFGLQNRLYEQPAPARGTEMPGVLQLPLLYINSQSFFLRQDIFKPISPYRKLLSCLRVLPASNISRAFPFIKACSAVLGCYLRFYIPFTRWFFKNFNLFWSDLDFFLLVDCNVIIFEDIT